MKKGIEKSLLVLAVLSACGMAYNMWAILKHKERVFLEKGPLALVEVLILAGFLLVLIFNLLAFFWLLRKVLSEQKTPFHMGALALNIICLVLMAGGKVLVDEIAREYRLAGWEAAGEWGVLYACFGVQMVFILLMLFYLVRLPGRK